jgi:hypothetical protein
MIKPLREISSEVVAGNWKNALLLALKLTLGLRIGLGVVMAAAWLIAEKYVATAQFNDPEIYGKLRMPISLLGKLLLGVWPRWDGVHHLNLAMRGYFDLSVGDSVFFPLYAGLTRLAAFLTGGEFISAGLLVSTLATIAVLTFIKLLGDRLFGEKAGDWAAVMLAIYPMSVFLIAPFTESLFLALTLGAFLVAYDRKWWLAALLSLLASLTRGPGMAASLAFAVMAWTQWKEAGGMLKADTWMAMLAALIAPIAGGAGFLAWRARAGFPPITDVLAEYVGTRVVDPLTGLARAVVQWAEVRDLPTTLDVVSVVLFIFITVLMFVRPRWRKWELVAYMAGSLVVLLSRSTEGAASLKSISRYVLVLFPAFLVLGDWLAGAKRWKRFTLLVISSSGLVIASALYALWFFLG